MRLHFSLFFLASAFLFSRITAEEAAAATVVTPTDVTVPATTTDAPMEDTKKNRVRLAVRYLKQNPVEEMMDNTLVNTMKSTHAKHHNMIRAAMDRLNLKKIHTVTRDALVRNLNVEELNYVIDMYSTELGKNVMKKMGAFLAEVNPVLNQEAYEALAAVNGGKIPHMEQKAPPSLNNGRPGAGLTMSVDSVN